MRAIDHPPDTRAASDADLMQTSVAQPELFATIFDRHVVAVHRYLSRRVGELADDLLSETFLIAFRKRAAYRAERLDVRPWLYGIANNLVRRNHRAEAARYRVLAKASGHVAVDGGMYADADERTDAHAIGQHLARALTELNADDREVLLLCAWGDLSPSEVAVVLGIPPGTVRSRLHRARQRVRAHLESTSVPLTSGANHE